VTRLLALCVLLASGGAPASTDAGDAPRVVSVRHALLLGDDGRTYDLDGGVWLDDATLMQRAKDLERLAAENRALRETPVAPPLAMTLAVLSALVLGVTGGYLLATVR